MNAGDICPDCELIGLPGALCPKHAATDDLLAACEQALSLLNNWGSGKLAALPAGEALRAAIAKAKG